MKSVHNVEEYKPILAQLQQRYRELKDEYQVNTAIIPSTRGDETWWKQRDQAKRQQAKDAGHDLVFIGDSITQGWEDAGKEAWEKHFGAVKSLNLGFSGDRTEHVLWRLKRNQLGQNRPQAAVVMIGTNNTGHAMQDPEQIAAGVTEVVATLKRQTPQTKILLLGILPRGEDGDDPMRRNNDAVNRLIAELDDGERVIFRDLSEVFLEADGTLSRDVMPDLLHLSAEGYRRWAEAIAPTLTQWNVIH